MIIQICEKCDRFYMVHNPDTLLKKCPNCKNEDLENIYGDDAHIWYLEGKLKVAKDQLALTEKALELACKNSKFEDTCEYCAYKGELDITNDCPRWCETDEKFFITQAMGYFKEIAKEMMKSE